MSTGKSEEEPTHSKEDLDGKNGITVTESASSILGSRKSSVDTSKISGRYIKCFAAISDQGHFQWVEVKKQNDLETEQELKAKLKGYSARSSYVIQLRPPKSADHETDEKRHSQYDHSSGEAGAETLAGTPSASSELIQVSMAHKLRLFFFCIKISPSALTEVLMNTVEATPRTPLNVTTTANAASRAAMKIRHRLSSSLSILATSALPPLPCVKSQSSTGSMSKGKNMTWPHENDTTTPLQQQRYHGNQSLHSDKATTTSADSTRPVLNRGSSASLKSNLSNISTAQPEFSHLIPGKEDEHIQFASPISAEPASPSSSTSSSSNVLSLAHSLQMAVMLNRQHSLSSDGRSSASGSSSGGEQSTTPSSQPPPSSSVKSKLTLSEVMAANQSAIPDSAATLEQSKLMQEQLELQQRVHRAEERTRAKQQQQKQQQQQRRELLLQQEQQQQQHQQQPQPQDSFRIQVDASSSQSVNAACPFLELSEDVDNSGEAFVTLKGYTETEEGWLALQTALDRFLDGPVKDQSSALPPEDTLIPSYHLPPEVQLSEKAQRYLIAKESLIEEVNLAKSKAAVEAARSPTPDVLSGGTILTANGPVAQIRATSVSLTRWINLSGGADRDRDRNK
ncbi:hypothetical protein BGZ65_008482, partial [Modicella reniformis]